MTLAFWDSPTTGTARTVIVPASEYGGINNPVGMLSSTGVGLYNATSGGVPYMVYNPSSAALAAFGWTGLPLRVLFYNGTLSSVADDGGTGTNPATNIGFHMTEGGTANIGGKLGYGASNDGSGSTAAVASRQDWPTLVVGIQGPRFWFPGSTGAGQQQRGWYNMITAVVRDVMAHYNVDPRFFYFAGCSGGATCGMEYVVASTFWPSRFPVRFAAVTMMAGALSGSGTRQNWPEGIPGENSTNQTFPRFARRIAFESGIPWWEVHSRADTTTLPSLYNPLMTPINQDWPTVGTPWTTTWSAGATLKQHGRYFRFLEYLGTNGLVDAPTHPQTFDTFFGDDVLGANLNPNGAWAKWMFDKSTALQRPAQPANQRLALFAGGSNSPAGPHLGTPEWLGLSSLSGIR